MSSSKGQFESGYQPEVTMQDKPGLQSKMPQEAQDTHIPTEDGGSQLYKAAGKLKGKKAVITGGDSGIGRATAQLFAMEGADVLITYLPQEEKDAQDVKSKVEKLGTTCHIIAVDLRSRENCQKVVDEAMSKMGKIDVLFNNAAIQQTRDDISQLPEDQWITTFDTNIHPYFFLSKYALKHMKAGSTIINNASINAYIGRPDLLDYTSTKGAIVSFTRGLANQFVAKNIRVNAIAPGPVWTPLVPSTMGKEQQEQFTAPIGRPCQPSEIATCVVFLASSDSTAICGQVIHCNGGAVLNV